MFSSFKLLGLSLGLLLFSTYPLPLSDSVLKKNKEDRPLVYPGDFPLSSLSQSTFESPRVLYVYGNVDEEGNRPSDADYDGEPFHQMRLNDTGNRGMSDFKTAIEEAGFEISEAYDQEITLDADFLANYEVLILGSNQKVWSSDEVQALNTWVRDGGGLIAWSDSAFGGAFQNVGLDNEAGRDSNNLLVDQFGMYFFPDQGGGGGDNLVNDWSFSHFLNTKEGLGESLVFRGEGCSPIRIDFNWPEKEAGDSVYQIAPFQSGGAGGTAEINDPDLGNGIQDYRVDCALALSEVGQGRVIGVFDRNTFWNNGEGTDLEEEDNRLFAQKLVQWASKTTLSEEAVSVEGELKLWHKITLTLEGPILEELGADNPFLDYRLEVTFRQGGRAFKVPGYFAADGNAAETSATEGRQWNVHFRPDNIGPWTYEVSFRSGQDVAVAEEDLSGVSNYFDGYTGEFTVGLSDKEAPDLRALGKLRKREGHYLQFAGGQYFLKAGADSPETFLAYTGFDGTYNHVDQDNLKSWAPHEIDWQDGDPVWQGDKGKGIIGAVNYLAGEGNNAFSFLSYNSGGDGKNVWPFVAHDEPLQYDCSKLAQWEIVFDHAESKGMFLHFKTQETENDNNNQWALDNGDLGRERKLYYRELIARFGHHLALNWNLGEENTQTEAQRKAMAAYISELDPYQNLIVLHTYPNQQEAVYTPLLGENSKLTGVSLQTPYNNVHKETLKWLKRSSEANKPWAVANDEQGPFQTAVPPDDNYPGYSGTSGPSQDAIRKNTLWGNLMAGGTGVEYYFGYQLPEGDLGCQDWRSRDRMWDYNRFALEFFQNFNVPFWDMQNENARIGNDNDNNSQYCLGQKGSAYVIYLANGGTSDIDLEDDDESYEIKWYDPRNGGLLQEGSLNLVNGGQTVNIGNPPSEADQDWVALLSSVSIPLAIDPSDPNAPSPRNYERAFKVFPNPAHDFIEIQWNRVELPNSRAALYNEQGQLVKEFHLNAYDKGFRGRIDRQNLARGVYYVRLRVEKEVLIRKVFLD